MERHPLPFLNANVGNPLDRPVVREYVVNVDIVSTRRNLEGLTCLAFSDDLRRGVPSEHRDPCGTTTEGNAGVGSPDEHRRKRGSRLHDDEDPNLKRHEPE